MWSAVLHALRSTFARFGFRLSKRNFCAAKCHRADVRWIFAPPAPASDQTTGANETSKCKVGPAAKCIAPPDRTPTNNGNRMPTAMHLGPLLRVSLLGKRAPTSETHGNTPMGPIGGPRNMLAPNAVWSTLALSYRGVFDEKQNVQKWT